jgi:O-antigen/teichoic acid export membrane protein
MTYGANVGVAALSLVNVLIVARALGPEGRGEVVFLTTVAVLTSALATLGVQQGIVNLASADPQLRRSLATNALVLAGVFGVIAMVCVGALIAVFPAVGADSPTGLIWLSLASIPVVVLGTYLQLLIQAEYGFAFTNAVWLLPSVVNVAVNGLLAALGVLTVASAVATWVAGQAVATALLAWYVARRSAGFGRLDLRLARRSLSFGVRSHVGSVMSLGNYRLDQWLLGSIAGTRELGLYSVAVAWSEALFFLPTALAAVQRPDLVRASPGEAGRSAVAVFRAAILVTIPIGVVMILLAPVLCVTLFGEDFRGSIDDLRVLVPGAIGIVALKLMANAITSRDRPGLASIGIGIAFAATIVLDLILIPPYGGLGAAIASTVAYTIGGVAMALLAARVLGVGLGAFVPRRGDAVWLVDKGRGMLHAVRSRAA